MSTPADQERLLAIRAQLIDALTDRLAGQLATRPELADVLLDAVDDRFRSLTEADGDTAAPADSGLSALVGLGPDAARTLGATRLMERVQPYDEQVAAERITGIGDLYYLYQHERIGVFRVVQKLKELFDAGSVRLSSGVGAVGLYRFDRRQVLRYTQRDRQAAYLRAFGYGRGPLVPGAQANAEFHPLFVGFQEQVARFWRDRRISEVMRDRAQDPSFGSIAIVRRAGLDLRNNLKFTSYGNVAVMRVEVMQLLGDAFTILGADDVKSLFGADGPWDVVEEVLTRYFGVVPVTSPRQRMAVTGRNVLRWLGQQYVLEESRPQFEAKLRLIADDAEEWLTSAQSIGVASQGRGGRVAVTSPPVARKLSRRRRAPHAQLV
jgi:hypothetical protein